MDCVAKRVSGSHRFTVSDSISLTQSESKDLLEDTEVRVPQELRFAVSERVHSPNRTLPMTGLCCIIDEQGRGDLDFLVEPLHTSLESKVNS